MTLATAIIARLSAGTIDATTELRTTPTHPYYLVQVRPNAPTGRRLTHQADTLPSTVWVMAVNNNAAGCTFLVERAIGLLDNFWLTPDGPAAVTFTGPVVQAEGPGDWRWSQGVEVRTYQPKEYPNV